MAQINRMIVFEGFKVIRPEDQAAFRKHTEERFGMTLEALHAERERHVPAFQIALHPARRPVDVQNAGGRSQEEEQDQCYKN